MQTLADRIEWAIKQAGISQREASRRAELNDAQLGLVLSRLRKNPDSEVTLPMLLSIARGLGVVDAWLLTGRGDPFDPNALPFHSEQPPLAKLSRWAELRRLAEQRAVERGRNVPAWAWVAAGACIVPLMGYATPALVCDLAYLCAEHDIGAPHETVTEPDDSVSTAKPPSAIRKATGTG